MGERESGELWERVGVGESDWEVEEGGERGERGTVRTDVDVLDVANVLMRTPRLRMLDMLERKGVGGGSHEKRVCGPIPHTSSREERGMRSERR